MSTTHFDRRLCLLGEGPLWHPTRKQLYWFDILESKMLTRQDGTPREWVFDEHVSAAGWLDDHTLIVAFETGLYRFSLDTGERELLVSLEADNSVTRSNDGRADAWGGFWIGTMGKQLESDAGAIYRFWKGELRRLYAPITIPNAICFSPDHRWAYFTDTPSQVINRQALDPETGWPVGNPTSFLDLTGTGHQPDGAVVDDQGNLLIASWGMGQVLIVSSDGQLKDAISFPASQVTCPALGGSDMATLFLTTAGKRDDPDNAHPGDGQVFALQSRFKGKPEPRVMLQ